MYENFVVEELLSNIITPYYYTNKKQREIDFVIECDGDVLPIEVKSGKDYTHHSALNSILSINNYHINSGIILSNKNIKEEGKITYYPIYMAMFLKEKEYDFGKSIFLILISGYILYVHS